MLQSFLLWRRISCLRINVVTLWGVFAPPGQRVRAGSNLRSPGGPWLVLPDLQRVEAVAQRALRRHLPAQPRHQRPGRPVPAGRTSHDPHALLYRDARVRVKRRLNAHTHSDTQSFTSARPSTQITTLSTHPHTHIVRCVNIIEGAVWQQSACVNFW